MESFQKIAILRRWPWPQRVKNLVLYVLIRGGVMAAEMLPTRGALRLFGNLAPYIFIREARRAQAQLRVALPELDARKTTRRMFVHFAESIWELSRLRLGVPKLDAAARRVLDEVLAEGKGAVFITGHIGNWELLGQSIAASGYPITTVAKSSYDPRLTEWLHQWRSSRGLRLIWLDKRNVGKAILRVLRQNSMMAFLIDQDSKTAGDFVPFFGMPAFTPTVPAALALRTGAPVIVCWHHRRGKQHRITIERVHYIPTGDAKFDVLALTAKLSDRLESIIREAPEQWVWLHKRWRNLRSELNPDRPGTSAFVASAVAASHNEGGHLLEHEDEPPEIRALYEAEMKKAGVPLRMPPVRKQR